MEHAPTTNSGTSTRLSLSPVLYNVYTKGLADLNNNGLRRMFTLADDGLVCKTTSDIYTVDRVRNQSKQGASPVVHPKQQSSRTSNASSLLQWRSHIKHKNSLRYFGIHFDRMLTYKMQAE